MGQCFLYIFHLQCVQRFQPSQRGFLYKVGNWNPSVNLPRVPASLWRASSGAPLANFRRVPIYYLYLPIIFNGFMIFNGFINYISCTLLLSTYCIQHPHLVHSIIQVVAVMKLAQILDENDKHKC